MASILAALFRLPLRIARPIVRPPISFVLMVCGVRVRRNYSLPVASLDEARAQPIFFALRRAATNEHVSTRRSSRRLADCRRRCRCQREASLVERCC